MKDNLKIIYFLILILLLFITRFVFAEDNNLSCSKYGFSVETINGIFTDDGQAEQNRSNLKKILPPTHNNEPIFLDYLLNPSHIGGLGDIVMATYQKFFDDKVVSDYDLIEMINSASQKVKTQKVLLVAHSQGNFYANSFYDSLSDKDGGIPSKSFGVYAVATPASRVAGGGKWITSDTDKIISGFVGSLPFKKIMSPNTHIELSDVDDKNGHSFSDVYLKYKAGQMISDIKASLDNLKSNDTQNENSPCIAPPKLSLTHKIEGGFLTVADFSANGIKLATQYSYQTNMLALNTSVNTVNFLASSLYGLVNSLASDSSKNTAMVLSSVSENENNPNTISIPEPNIEIPSSVTKSEPIAIKNNPIKKEDKTDPVIDPEIKMQNISTSSDKIIENKSIPVSPQGLIPGQGGWGGGGGVAQTSQPNPTPEVPKVLEKVVDTVPPKIDIKGDNPMIIKIGSVYEDSGAYAKDDVDGDVSVVATSTVDTSKVGTYEVSYDSTDLSGNTSSVKRIVKVVSNIYIPNYSFGIDSSNRDWQVWSFGGSNIYDWSDTYFGGYLREQFKIQTLSRGFWCNRCIQRGIFKNDPRLGFESSDLTISSLEGSPQNNQDNTVYDVVIQWDSSGYTTIISHGGFTDYSSHTDISGVGENMFVGWDGSFNNFQTFPSGEWIGQVDSSIMKRTGGADMILVPYKVFDPDRKDISVGFSLPISGSLAGDGIDPTRGRGNVTEFKFGVVFKDLNGNYPTKVLLKIKNKTDGNNLSDVEMNKVVSGEGDLSDGDFTNGEIFLATSTFPISEYSYWFEATLDNGQEIKLEDSRLRFTVIPSTYTYIPKNSFGIDNGDGKDWKSWMFGGSSVYDWSDSYIDGYLNESFKIKTVNYARCNQCLQRGIFSHDPQKGFEVEDVSLSSLESNPQNNMDNMMYSVSIQWDAEGYSYHILKGEEEYASGRTNVSNVKNIWVGWDGSFNNFQTFPSGEWIGENYYHPELGGAGTAMVTKPFKVYIGNNPPTI